MLKLINIKSCLAIIIVLLLSISCTENVDKNQQVRVVDKKEVKQNLVEVNRELIKKEMEDIDNYLDGHKLNMIRTGSGLRYFIEKQGDTTPIKTGDIVTLDYEMHFLNSDETVASSKENGLKTFLVGHGGVEIGMEEAVLHLHKGDEAEIIIPSYLAYGLIGDGNSIPPLTTLVYKVKVVENQSNK